MLPDAREVDELEVDHLTSFWCASSMASGVIPVLPVSWTAFARSEPVHSDGFAAFAGCGCARLLMGYRSSFRRRCARSWRSSRSPRGRARAPSSDDPISPSRTKSTTYADPVDLFLPPVRPAPPSVTVMPCTLTSTNASLTSSSRNGLMMALIFIASRAAYRPPWVSKGSHL